MGEWASPGVVVHKPHGTPRFCVYYRRLDLVTVKDAYLIPRMDEFLDFWYFQPWTATRGTGEFQ